MLYQTILPEFAPQLLLFGALAAFFAMLLIYNLHNYQPFHYKKGVIVLCSLLCAFFIILFIRVTAPYKNIADFLFGFSVLISVAAVFAAAFSLSSYKKEKIHVKAPLNINILHHVDDYTLVFDKDGFLIFSTCPNELEAKVRFLREETAYEIDHGGQNYLLSYSPVMDKDTVVGFIGIINNITVEKKLLSDLSDKIKGLNIINQELDKQVNIDDALLIAKHQQQVSLEIQEKIAKKISELIKMIAQIEDERSKTDQIRNVELLAEKLRFILQDIRKIVYGR